MHESDIAIRIESLSKLYRIGPRERYKALRDTLTDVLYTPFRALATIVRRPMIANHGLLSAVSGRNKLISRR